MASMKKSGTKLFLLLALLLNIDACFGRATTTIKCMDAAIPGQKTTLSCEITGTVSNGIQWIQPNNGSPKLIIYCNTPNDDCTLESGVTGYSVAINPATQQHTLTIDSFNTTLDFGVWTCRDGSPGVGQISCTKPVAEQDKWPVALSCVLGILIVVGIVLVILVVVIFKLRDDSLKKILTKVLLAVGVILLIMAIVTAVLLGIQSNLDLGEAIWIATIVLCAFGFVFGIVFVVVGVLQILKPASGKLDSRSVDAEHTELRSPTASAKNGNKSK